MDLITDLKDRDTVIFTIQEVGCFHSGLINVFNITKTNYGILLSFRNDTARTKKILLTSDQLKVLSKIEKQIKSVGSTTYDKYQVTKGSRTITRSRDVKYSKTLIEFFN
jgi:hypothetical protein